jgi:hypothetical protein
MPFHSPFSFAIISAFALAIFHFIIAIAISCRLSICHCAIDYFFSFASIHFALILPAIGLAGFLFIIFILPPILIAFRFRSDCHFFITPLIALFHFSFSIIYFLRIDYFLFAISSFSLFF